uniref:Uncharacterized protein n=1 Tax=viral metagenome TaxID=1070528 RepID=A0A6M3LS41_9ZZZZ
MVLPGWGTFAGGIGAFLGKLSTYVPGKVEKLKNEKERLEKEKDELSKINMDINNPEHRKKANRLTAVIKRINVIDIILKNKATD